MKKILLVLMMLPLVVLAQTKKNNMFGPVPAVLLVSDTTSQHFDQKFTSFKGSVIKSDVFTMNGYIVYKDAKDKLNPGRMSWIYLDGNKQPLDKKYHVWLDIERR